MLEKDAKYDNAQAEVEDQRKIIKKLRQKFHQAEQELAQERAREGDDKEEYLTIIREQEKDLDFYKGICSMMLKDSEMYKLKEKIKYDFDT